MANQTVKAREAEKAQRRRPLSSQNRLEVVGEIPGYKLRIVKDTPGRIDRFIDAGWEPTDRSEVSVGTSRANVANQESTTNYIDLGGGAKGLLMKQKIEWNEEDRAIHDEKVDRLEEAVKNPALEGRYGSIDIQS